VIKYTDAEIKFSMLVMTGKLSNRSFKVITDRCDFWTRFRVSVQKNLGQRVDLVFQF